MDPSLIWYGYVLCKMWEKLLSKICDSKVERRLRNRWIDAVSEMYTARVFQMRVSGE